MSFVSDFSTITMAIIGCAFVYLHTQSKDEVFKYIYLFSALSLFVVSFFVSDLTVDIAVKSVGGIFIAIVFVYGYRILADLIGF